MTKIAVMALLFWGTILVAQAKPSDVIGSIDFYGYQGLNVARLRAALPVQVGSTLTKRTKPMIEKAVAKVTGEQPTDVAQVCCDPKGRSLIYIGLRGETFHSFALDPAPTGAEHLPPDIVDLSSRADHALYAAVIKGDAAEDDSQGYALSKNPAARALQMQERTWALAHGPELVSVVRDSVATNQREIASELLGYAQQSPAQIAALVHASRDPDDEVRNNATRALGVLVMSNPNLTEQIEPDTFLAMLGSGIWTDHNKAIWLLASMTVSRDPQLMAKIRAKVFEQLVEIARWSDPGHAVGARLVLGRIAGIPEDKLQTVAWGGPPDAIIDAAKKK